MDRLISEQAVIDAVSEWLYDKTRKESIETVIKAIPSAEPKWIPVSEGVPKRNGYYLVTGRQGAVNKRLYQDGHWYGNWAILAWMPLPEPYKIESEVKE